MSTHPLPDNPKVLVLGAGSWGTGIGDLLAHQEAHVTIWARKEELANEINQSHTNSHYLPGIALHPELHATTDLTVAADCDLIVFVIPSAGTAQVAEALREVPLKEHAVFLSCAKGIERGTGRRMSEVIAASHPDRHIAILSGPNHAEEVVRKQATCAVIGSSDQELACSLQHLFSAPHFRTYRTEDVAGIELGGAIKNIFAIAAGTAKGLGLGDNAIAALVTRGLAEMIRLGTALGGHADTFVGLSGVGDLITTCYSNHSRNHRVGLGLGKGDSLEAVQKSLGMVAEGVPNTQSIYELAQKVGVRTPLIDAVYGILYQGQSAPDSLRALLSRDLRSERE